MAERRDDLGTGDEASLYGGAGAYGARGAADLGATNTAGTSGSRDVDDPAAIRADIRETRERLGDTLEEIGDRLNPRQLAEQVKDNLREATIGRARNAARSAADRVNETRYSIMDTIRDNPIPAAMIGIGLAWLLMNRRRENTAGAQYYGASSGADAYRGTAGYTDAYAGDTGYAYAGAPYGGASYPAGGYAAADASTEEERGRLERARERASHLGHDVKDAAGNVASRARETAGSVADRTKHAASSVADRTKHAASSVADRTKDVAGTVADRSRQQARRAESTFYEQPLAVGAATIALGLAAGMAIPATDREVRLMGDARDKLVDRAREMAHETREKVENVVERVAEDAKDTARQAAREEGLTSNNA